jgi:hypothetical protein
MEKLYQIRKNYSHELRYLIEMINEPSRLEAISDSVDWKILCALARRHRMLNWLLNGESASLIPQEIKQKLKVQLFNQHQKNRVFLKEIQYLHSLLKSNKIPHLFLKGVLLSLQIYDNPEVRFSRDIDLMIHPDYFDEAVKLLVKHADGEQLNKGFFFAIEKYTRKDVEIYCHGNLIELHRYLIPNNGFGLKNIDFQNDISYLKHQNQFFPVLSNTKNILFLLTHGSVHQFFRLFWLTDLARIFSGFDYQQWSDLEMQAKIHAVQIPFYQTSILCKVLFGTAVSDDVVKRGFKKRSVRSVAELAMLAIGGDVHENIGKRLKRLVYLAKLGSGFAYKMRVIFGGLIRFMSRRFLRL